MASSDAGECGPIPRVHLIFGINPTSNNSVTSPLSQNRCTISWSRRSTIIRPHRDAAPLAFTVSAIGVASGMQALCNAKADRVGEHCLPTSVGPFVPTRCGARGLIGYAPRPRPDRADHDAFCRLDDGRRPRRRIQFALRVLSSLMSGHRCGSSRTKSRSKRP
jgi:hypothetical protein